MNLLEFYPTPSNLIDKMIDRIDFKKNECKSQNVKVKM
jgi:hypothetical protein